MGGLKVTGDLVLSEFAPESASILILPGGNAWTGGDRIGVANRDYHYLSQNETHQFFSEEQHTRTSC
jgi:hypothetical protein